MPAVRGSERRLREGGDRQVGDREADSIREGRRPEKASPVLFEVDPLLRRVFQGAQFRKLWRRPGRRGQTVSRLLSENFAREHAVHGIELPESIRRQHCSEFWSVRNSRAVCDSRTSSSEKRRNERALPAKRFGGCVVVDTGVLFLGSERRKRLLGPARLASRVHAGTGSPEPGREDCRYG